MASEITSEIASRFRHRLEQHPIYAAVESIEHLRCFMQHHVYSVWDFMSLIKYLQSVVAPSSQPWSVVGDAAARRFINELVLEEESDEAPFSGGFCSHFELYQQAMVEVGADTTPSQRFVERVETDGIAAALASADIPEPARRFTTATFAFIDADRPHIAAAALALGREHIIPVMFRAILLRFGVDEGQAPLFHHYLKRHIHLDEDFHAPLSLRLLNGLCAGAQTRVVEAIAAGETAVCARLEFWDAVYHAMRGKSVTRSTTGA